ncbi:5'-nucleotidase C-terminal domain-containing protein [Gemmatimonas sp.]|uniref:5'-nucleotidase C-terminal domain-containing protein n=1 Tax=Gemmatimonas sp. TaxID=1962908 RepID=UPI00286DA1FE|nr:5'-nucleotidase C-terminal domain-containing protein [Gemmatimonas sp.]
MGRLPSLFTAAALTLAAVTPLPAQSGRFDLVIAATTDVHGRLRGWDYYANAADPARSLAGAATIVDSVRAANPGRVLLVEGGDILSGNPLLYVAAKVAPPPVHPVIAAMNVMRYDAAVIGNHEFNYGVPALRAAIAKAAFPFVAANVRDGQGRPFVAPYTLIDRRGVNIAIIGGTTPGSMLWDRDHLREAGLTVTDIVTSVRAAVAEVRKRKADVVVVLLHSGLDGAASYDTVATGLASENVAARVPREIDGINLVVYGHSHAELVDSTINGALLVQPRNWAASVALATLTLEKSKGKWGVVKHRGQSVKVAGHAESPAVLAASAVTHKATVTWVSTPVGRTAVRWRADSARVVDAPITDLINEVMRRESGADLSATAAFSLDASLDTGAVTQAALSRLYPYENTLRAVRITGAQLRAFLEQSALYYRTLAPDGSAPAGGLVDPKIPGFNFDVVSGVDYVIDVSKPAGARITSLTRNGRAVQPTDSFTMALNNYRQSGGGGYAMLATAPVVFQKDIDIRSLIIDDVTKAGTLDPAKYATTNWRLEPAAARALAYREQNRGRAAEAAGGAPTAVPSSAVPPSTAAATPQGRTLRVISMSDFHGALSNRPDDRGRSQGGAVALSAAIEKAQRECTGQCQSVVVDAGDLFSGAPASDWDAGKPTVAVFNRLHVAAGAIGNHEFDFGQDTLRMRLKELKYAVLGANVRGADGRLLPWMRADTVVVRGGVRIGLIGTAGEHTATSTKVRNVRQLKFLDAAPIISERVRALRAGGAQIVVAMAHDGARCDRDKPEVCSGGGLDIVDKLTDMPDVFVMGHSHTNIVLRRRDMPVVQTSSNGRAIAVVDVPLDGEVARAEIRNVYGEDRAGADPVVDSIVTAATRKVQVRMERPVATLAVAFLRRGNQHALGNLVADAARVKGNADFGAWNSGGIRTDLPAGPINFGGVHGISPFGNVLVRIRLRGRDVPLAAERWVWNGRANSHVSGMTIEFDPAKPQGKRVVRVLADNGAPLDPERIYSIAINDFMIDDPEGASLARTISVEMLTTRDIDMLASYLQGLPQPVRGDTTERIRAVGAGAAK